MGTYHGGLERLEHLLVALDDVVAGRDRWNVNGNVSIGLRQRVADLVRKLGYVVLDF